MNALLHAANAGLPKPDAPPEEGFGPSSLGHERALVEIQFESNASAPLASGAHASATPVQPSIAQPHLVFQASVMTAPLQLPSAAAGIAPAAADGSTVASPQLPHPAGEGSGVAEARETAPAAAKAADATQAQPSGHAEEAANASKTAKTAATTRGRASARIKERKAETSKAAAAEPAAAAAAPTASKPPSLLGKWFKSPKQLQASDSNATGAEAHAQPTTSANPLKGAAARQRAREAAAAEAEQLQQLSAHVQRSVVSWCIRHKHVAAYDLMACILGSGLVIPPEVAVPLLKMEVHLRQFNSWQVCCLKRQSMHTPLHSYHRAPVCWQACTMMCGML